jgi:hypothetical protein
MASTSASSSSSSLGGGSFSASTSVKVSGMGAVATASALVPVPGAEADHAPLAVRATATTGDVATPSERLAGLLEHSLLTGPPVVETASTGPTGPRAEIGALGDGTEASLGGMTFVHQAGSGNAAIHDFDPVLDRLLLLDER